MMLLLFNFLNQLFPGALFYGVRRACLSCAGLRVGKGVKVNYYVRFFGHNVSIGRDTWVGPECKFYSNKSAFIQIGACCDVAPSVSFVTGSHKVGSTVRRAGPGYSTNIIVGDGCWLGHGATLLGGVTLGQGTIVAAGALVLPGVYPADVLLAGVPAKIKKNLV